MNLLKNKLFDPKNFDNWETHSKLIRSNQYGIGVALNF